MTWVREKVAKIEMANGVLQATGWEGRRHCGCSYFQGIRLDDQEMTFGATACPEHEFQARRAMEFVKNIPPRDEEMHVLWQRTLDQEIDVWLQTNQGV